MALSRICDGGGGKCKIIKYLRLLYIKRCDAFNNSSFGTDIGNGAQFKTPPRLPHGPNGIIVSPYAVIDDGKDCRNAPILGDNVSIGAGAKLIGKIRIGNNVKIGANAIVVEDVPDGATVVAPKARIIVKQ